MAQGAGPFAGAAVDATQRCLRRYQQTLLFPLEEPACGLIGCGSDRAARAAATTDRPTGCKGTLGALTDRFQRPGVAVIAGRWPATAGRSGYAARLQQRL